MYSLAAVDVGSNAIRLAVVRLSEDGSGRNEGRRYALRLGTSVFSQGRIDRETRAQLAAVFSDIAMHMRRLHVVRYRAVATSAMRDAQNGEEVARELRRCSGIELEIIDGAEEGRLVREGLLRALGSVREDALLVDLGGGSLELELATGGGCSVAFGTVRLLQRFAQLAGAVPQRELRRVEKVLRQEMGEALGNMPKAPLAIGTGGNLDALARLLPASKVSLPAIALRRLGAFAKELARLDAAERAQRYGLRADRADVILPAVLVIRALAQQLHTRVLVVPGTGLRESLLRELAAAEVAPSGARSVAQRLGCQGATADNRAALAHRLFELLAPVHGLWPPVLPALDAACYLRDSGALIDPQRPLVHTHYLLQHASGLTLSPPLRRLAAHVIAAAADAKMPGPPLAKGWQRAAVVLTGLVRLAGALAEQQVLAARLRVNLLTSPTCIEAGLVRQLPSAALTPLEHALGRRVKVH